MTVVRTMTRKAKQQLRGVCRAMVMYVGPNLLMPSTACMVGSSGNCGLVVGISPRQRSAKD